MSVGDPPRVIQHACQITDDEPRWLVALISDTGMRLNEAAGLAKEDIVWMQTFLTSASMEASEDQRQRTDTANRWGVSMGN